MDINSATADESQFCVHAKSLFRNPEAIKSVNVVVIRFLIFE